MTDDQFGGGFTTISGESGRGEGENHAHCATLAHFGGQGQSADRGGPASGGAKANIVADARIAAPSAAPIRGHSARDRQFRSAPGDESHRSSGRQSKTALVAPFAGPSRTVDQTCDARGDVEANEGTTTGIAVPHAAPFGGQTVSESRDVHASGGESHTFSGRQDEGALPTPYEFGGRRMGVNQDPCAPGRESQEAAEPLAQRALPATFEATAVSGERGANYNTPANGASHLLPIIAQLSALQKQRVFAIKTQQRADRSIEALLATMLGYSVGQEQADRKAAFKIATTIRKHVEAGTLDGASLTEDQRQVAETCAPMILLSFTGRQGFDKHRRLVERQMRKLARDLPAYAWAETVKGFSDLGLAIIVAEAGDLSSYATKERVWKRLGLAVIEGERQQRKAGVEAAAAHGFNARRRAEIWSLLSDAMFRHQWAGEKDDRPAGPAGPYGEVYALRKAATAERGWTPGHRHNDARRVMSKALIADLWRVSCGMEVAQHYGPQKPRRSARFYRRLRLGLIPSNSPISAT